MQEIEKMSKEFTEGRRSFQRGEVLQKQLLGMIKLILILCIPFAVESVHQLLGRII